jgi:hypothetical protein
VDRIRQLRNIVHEWADPADTPVLCTVLLLALISFSFDPSLSMEGVLRWEGSVMWMESVLPTLQHGVVLLCFYWITVLLPASFFPKMHPLIGSALRFSSWLIGAVCWWQSFIVTYRLLGLFSVVTGLLFGGVGVVPFALFAVAAKGDWNIFGNLMITLNLTLAARVLARIIAKRAARMRLAIREKDYSVDDYNL